MLPSRFLARSPVEAGTACLALCLRKGTDYGRDATVPIHCLAAHSEPSRRDRLTYRRRGRGGPCPWQPLRSSLGSPASMAARLESGDWVKRCAEEHGQTISVGCPATSPRPLDLAVPASTPPGEYVDQRTPRTSGAPSTDWEERGLHQCRNSHQVNMGFGSSLTSATRQADAPPHEPGACSLV